MERLSAHLLSEALESFCEAVKALPELQVRDIILYGSYARGDADAESDVDIMILTDLSKEEIANRRRLISNIAADIDLDYDMVLSPVIVNKAVFQDWSDALPFYRNVKQEGVLLHAS